MTIALMVGRFQPFHNGHLKLVKLILKVFDTLFIVIGSAQHKATADNPYSLAKRELMIKETLKAENITSYELFALDDARGDEVWMDKLLAAVPRFDVFYTADGITPCLMKKRHFEVRTVDKFDNINATKIRKMMKNNNKEWKTLVPEAVAKILAK